MKTIAFVSTLAVLSPTLGLAQVRSEADLFGGSEEEKKVEDDKPSERDKDPKAETGTEAKKEPQEGTKVREVMDTFADSELIDKMQIGGRLELRANAGKVDDQRFQ
ncbi:MAG: hypothetical protein EOP07_17280, partial [Proteobacteria bacterium]